MQCICLKLNGLVFYSEDLLNKIYFIKMKGIFNISLHILGEDG